MKTYLLERIEKEDTHTLGRFWFNGNTVYTLELPWKNNEKNISCIPTGLYEVELTYSPRFKKMLWLVKDVPNRSGIRIHPANYVHQLHGCIAPGLNKQDLDNDGTIDLVNSKKALSWMREEIAEKFKLEIIWNDLLTS